MKKSSFAADRSTTYKFDIDNYKNIPARPNINKLGAESFSSHYSN
jgi:hypothetical protein